MNLTMIATPRRAAAIGRRRMSSSGSRVRVGCRLGPVVLLAFTLATCLSACGTDHPQQANPSADTAPIQSSATRVESLAVGKSTQTITIDGQARTFQVYRPSGLTKGFPLVVMLHGGYGSGTQAETSYHWDGQADRSHFVVAYPDGLNGSWNAGGGCCGASGRKGVDDVGFVTAVVRTLQREAAIDPARTYATGISNGGILTYRLACETTLFAAIGPVSATMLAPCDKPAATSVIAIHGTSDPTIPYQGGRGRPYGPSGAAIDGPSILSVNQTWRTVDSCADPTSTSAGPVTTSIASCRDRRTVELITIAGAGHQWPGGTDNPAARAVLHTDPPSQALDATSVVWQFFAARP